MFASDLCFSQAIMSARRAGRAQVAPAVRVVRLPGERPSARQAAGRGR